MMTLSLFAVVSEVELITVPFGAGSAFWGRNGNRPENEKTPRPEGAGGWQAPYVAPA
jgi:hypothetical protein